MLGFASLMAFGPGAVLAGCTDSEGERAVASKATVAIDPVCRNGARARSESDTWLIAEHLPPTWRGLEEVEGTIESGPDGRLWFVSGDQRLAISTSDNSPTVCFGWNEPDGDS